MVFLQLPKLSKTVVIGTGLHSVPQMSQALFLLLNKQITLVAFLMFIYSTNIC